MSAAISRLGRACILFIACGLVVPSYGLAASTPAVRIGVLAVRGTAQAKLDYQPTAAYLEQHIPGRHFEIVPLTYDDVDEAMAQRSVDFAVLNPSSYVYAEETAGVSRIATLKYAFEGRGYQSFGAVIFTRASSGITDFADLKGKRFSAVAMTSTGGWLAGWGELDLHGIDPARDFSALEFHGDSQDLVVQAVLDGKADAGCVRTGILEQMAAEGTINLADVRVIGERHDTAFPMLHSSVLYPEWAFAQVRGTDTELAEAVAATLFEMSPDDPAAKAAGSTGWTIPLDYGPVRQLMRHLEVPPFAAPSPMTLAELLRRYWMWVVLGAALLLGMSVITGMAIRLSRRLAAANAHLVEASLAKNRFMANMSHELRTPLNSIIGFSGVLLQELPGPLNDEQKTQLGMVQRSSKQLSALIDDVLDISRIEAGQEDVRSAPLALYPFVHEIEEAIRPIAEGKGLSLLVEAPDGGITVVTGARQVRQILLNLLGNAVKFTDEGRVRLDVTVTDQRVRFAVSDTGRGIAPAQIERIFDEFQQLDAPTGGNVEGTGLGLAISARLAALLGGGIEVESTEGVGSTFVLDIPRKLKAASPRS